MNTVIVMIEIHVDEFVGVSPLPSCDFNCTGFYTSGVLPGVFRFFKSSDFKNKILMMILKD